MAHTNSTPNYSLPQFLPTDKPAWLVDVNGAYSAIDTAMKNNADAATAAQGDATQALSDASSASTAASSADGKASGMIASVSDVFSSTETYNVGDLVIYNNLLYKCFVAVTTPGIWTGSFNWIRTTLEAEINKVATDAAAAIAGTTGTVEVHTGSDVSINIQRLIRIGNIVFLSVTFASSSQITNGTQLFDLPAGFIPSTPGNQFAAFAAYNDDKDYPVIINQSGVFLFSNNPAPTNYTFILDCWYSIN